MCRYLLSKHVQAASCCLLSSSDSISVHVLSSVDIGGGTVDISAHKVSSTPDQHIQVVHPPTGNEYAGSRVNKEFKAFLGRLVNDKKFTRYVQTNDPLTNARHSTELNELVNKIFEEQVVFGCKTSIFSAYFQTKQQLIFS